MKKEKWIAFDYHTKKQSNKIPYTFDSEEQAKEGIYAYQKDRKVCNTLTYPLLKSRI